MLVRISAASTKSSTSASLIPDERHPDARWFSGGGCIVQEGERCRVFVRGRSVGSYDSQDRDPRNILAVSLSEDASAHLGELAQAFGI